MLEEHWITVDSKNKSIQQVAVAYDNSIVVAVKIKEELL